MQVVIIAFIRVASVLTNLLDQHELIGGQVSLVHHCDKIMRVDIFEQVECFLAVCFSARTQGFAPADSRPRLLRSTLRFSMASTVTDVIIFECGSLVVIIVHRITSLQAKERLGFGVQFLNAARNN